MTTNLTIILDKSGSMDSVRDATISGLNEYIESLAKDGNHYHVNLTLFDTEVSHPWRNEAMGGLKLTEGMYRPVGMTALYDAVCSTLKKIKPSEDVKQIVVIMTDGQENSSKEYTEKDMKKLVEERQKLGNYTFVFMGANQDAYAEAAKYGISRANSMHFNASSAGIGETYVVAAAATSRMASMDAMSTGDFYTASEQKKVKETE
jgi:predicted glutamine amidotransferase